MSDYIIFLQKRIAELIKPEETNKSKTNENIFKSLKASTN